MTRAVYRRGYFSFPLSGNFERGVLLDKTRYTDNTVISYYYKERYRTLPQNTRRDYHKTLDETTTKHSITTTTKHSTTKTAKSGVVTGLKGIFRGCDMYTYMYCMYRIERHNSRRLLLRAASICAIREKTGVVSLLWFHE